MSFTSGRSGTGQPLSVLWGEGVMDLPRMRLFLSGLAAGLKEPAAASLLAAPILADIAALCAAAPGGTTDAAASWGPVRRGLNRRYLRVRFVQRELERLDFKKAPPGVRFNDFVFTQIDFSAYKKIPVEEYSLYSREGLEDFDPTFFTRNFRLSRETALDLIQRAYIRIGGFYYIRQKKLLSNPLLMAVLRNLQTSLDFAPLFTSEAVRDECRTLSRDAGSGAAPLPEDRLNRLPETALTALHGASMIHPDGMKTDLSAMREGNILLLKGAFHPHGKTYTITLAKS
jgi:hypothetical protein